MRAQPGAVLAHCRAIARDDVPEARRVIQLDAMRQLVHEFGQRFQEAHGLKLAFTEAAADALVVKALESSKPVRDLCAERFKDYQFGLKLIAQNTGRKEFTVDVDSVENPDKVLSEWVVASYRSHAQEG